MIFTRLIASLTLFLSLSNAQAMLRVVPIKNAFNTARLLNTLHTPQMLLFQEKIKRHNTTQTPRKIYYDAAKVFVRGLTGTLLGSLLITLLTLDYAQEEKNREEPLSGLREISVPDLMAHLGSLQDKDMTSSDSPSHKILSEFEQNIRIMHQDGHAPELALLSQYLSSFLSYFMDIHHELNTGSPQTDYNLPVITPNKSVQMLLQNIPCFQAITGLLLMQFIIQATQIHENHLVTKPILTSDFFTDNYAYFSHLAAPDQDRLIRHLCSYSTREQLERIILASPLQYLEKRRLLLIIFTFNHNNTPFIPQNATTVENLAPEHQLFLPASI